jgi:hypothetical protein
MARNKAELKAVRARQMREPKVALRSPEDIETERREREAAFDARHWNFMDGNFIHKEQPPKPKDTHKQSTLPECMSSAQSAKSVRHASPAMKAHKQDDEKLPIISTGELPHLCPQLTPSLRASSCCFKHSRMVSSPSSLYLLSESAIIAWSLCSA